MIAPIIILAMTDLATVLAVGYGLFILALFGVNPRDDIDTAWHYCAWCRDWWNDQTGVRQLTVPRRAPRYGGKVTHGLCERCFTAEKRDLDNLPEPINDIPGSASCDLLSGGPGAILPVVAREGSENGPPCTGSIPSPKTDNAGGKPV